MAQVAMTAGGGTTGVSNIGKNLFWDDVRIGLNLLPVGVVFLLLGGVAGPWMLPFWVQAGALVLGGILTVLSLKICASIPRESGVNFFAQTAFFAAALAFLLLIGILVMPGKFEVLIGFLVLGSVAHILLALELKGCAGFLGDPVLKQSTGLYLGLTVLFSLAYIGAGLLLPSGLAFIGPVAQGLALVDGAFLLFLATGLSAALQHAQQGAPLVAAPGGVIEISEKTSTPKVSDKPEPLPPEFAFSKTEVDGFQAQDSTAGKAVVILMAGVFCVGVILYTVIAVMASF